MAKIPLEVMEFKRFVRQDEELFFGQSHLAIIREMGWEGTRDELIQRLKYEGGLQLDMGIIQRWDYFVGISSYSDTFRYPYPDIFAMVRARTMKVLRTKYEEDTFKELD